MSLGRLLIGAGTVLIVLGLLFLLVDKFHIHPGRLPGDLVIRGEKSTIYFPLVTCLIISVVLTLLLWLFRR